MTTPYLPSLPNILREKIITLCRKEVKFKASLHVTGMLSLTPDRRDSDEIIVKITETITDNTIDARHQQNFASLLDYFERLSQTDESVTTFSVSNNSAFKRVETKESDNYRNTSDAERTSDSNNGLETSSITQHFVSEGTNHNTIDANDRRKEPQDQCSAMVSPPFLTNMVLNVGKNVVTPTLVSRSTEPEPCQISTGYNGNKPNDCTPKKSNIEQNEVTGFSPVESLICLARKHPQLAQMMKDRLKSGQFSPQVIKLFSEAKRKLVGDPAKKSPNKDSGVVLNGPKQTNGACTQSQVVEKTSGTTLESTKVQSIEKTDESEKIVKHTPDLIKVLHEKKKKLQEGKPRSQILGITRQKNLSFDPKVESSDVQAESPVKDTITKSKNLSFEPEKPVRLEEGLFARAMHEFENKGIDTGCVERMSRKDRKRQSLGKRVMLKRAKLAEKKRSQATLPCQSKAAQMPEVPDIKVEDTQDLSADEACPVSESSMTSAEQKSADIESAQSVQVHANEQMDVASHNHFECDLKQEPIQLTPSCESVNASDNRPVDKDVQIEVHKTIDTKDENACSSNQSNDEICMVSVASGTENSVLCGESDKDVKNVEVSIGLEENAPGDVTCPSNDCTDNTSKEQANAPGQKPLDDSGLTGITMIGVDLLQSELGLSNRHEEPPDVLDCSWSSDPGVESFVPEESMRYLEEESRDSVHCDAASVPFRRYSGSNSAELFSSKSNPGFVLQDESSVGFSPLKVKPVVITPRDSADEGWISMENVEQKREDENRLELLGGCKITTSMEEQQLKEPEAAVAGNGLIADKSVELRSKQIRKPAIYVKTKPIIQANFVQNQADEAIPKLKDEQLDENLCDQSKIPRLSNKKDQSNELSTLPKGANCVEEKKSSGVKFTEQQLKSPPSRRKSSNPKRYCDIRKPKERKCKKCGVPKICKKCSKTSKNTHKSGDKCKAVCLKCGSVRKKALDASPKKLPNMIAETCPTKKKGYKTPSKKSKRKKHSSPRTKSHCKRGNPSEDTPHHTWPTFSSLQKATPAQRTRLQTMHGLPKFDLESPKTDNKSKCDKASKNCSDALSNKCAVSVHNPERSKESKKITKDTNISDENQLSIVKENSPINIVEKKASKIQIQQPSKSRIILGNLVANLQVPATGNVPKLKDTRSSVLPASATTASSHKTKAKDTETTESKASNNNCRAISPNPSCATVTGKPLIHVSPSSGSHLLVLPPPIYQHDKHAHPKYSPNADYPCNIVIKQCQVAERKSTASPPKLPAEGQYVHFVKDKVSIRNSRPAKRKKSSEKDGPQAKSAKWQWPSELLREHISPVGKGRAGKVRKKEDDSLKVKQKWIQTYKPAESP